MPVKLLNCCSSLYSFFVPFYLFFNFFQHFPENVTIKVPNINPVSLGKELLRRCGNEGQWPYNDAVTTTTLKFLQASISYIPLALETSADLSNAAFILSQPGNEFVIRSGNADWEFYFSQDYKGDISGKCLRKPYLRYYYDKISSTVRSILSLASAPFMKMIGY